MYVVKDAYVKMNTVHATLVMEHSLQLQQMSSPHQNISIRYYDVYFFTMIFICICIMYVHHNVNMYHYMFILIMYFTESNL